MSQDAVLIINNGFYDFQIDEDGDIRTDEFFDTAILYSLFGERRAAPDEVVDPERRRGWIGNDSDFENGSKLWLLYQARLTRDTLNRVEDEASKALQWLVDDGYAVAIEDVSATVNNGQVLLGLTIRRSRDRIVRRFYELWEATGRA
jgi:phage gp46-like protein